MAEFAISSFRDPSGQVKVTKDRVVRWVNATGQEDLEAYFASGTIRRAQEEGRAVSARRLSPQETQQLGPELQDTGIDDDDEAQVTAVEHNKVPFVSYPYEWPSEMLAAAGSLTLELQKGLLEEGLSLKDATPYNILFDGPRPVFIDALSVEKRDPHDAFWRPHGQFERTFLLPLLAARSHGLPLSASLLWQRDGLEPETLYKMSSSIRRLRSPHLWLVTLPTKLNARAERQGDKLYQPRPRKNPDEAKYVLVSAIRSLEKRLKQVRPEERTRSHWSGYMDTRGHYSESEAAHKDSFVKRALEQLPPKWLLDVGANTGHFSAMAAATGARVVAIDQDPVSVGRIWRSAAADGHDILPLVVDIARPPPAAGWMNKECPSFLQRAEGRFDMVLMLAVMHHLHVTQRIPVPEILRLVARLTRGHAVVEYVGPEDPMFRRLLRGRDHLHTGLTPETFKQDLSLYFDVLAEEPLHGSDRTLYLLRRNQTGDHTAEPVPVAATGRQSTGGET